MQVGFFSAPRTVNYLSGTLRSYFSEWQIKPTVYEEPGWGFYDGHSKVNRHINPERLGLVANWASAICFMRLVEDDWYMLMEDDIQFSRGSGKRIRDHLAILTQDIPITVSPYCSVINAPLEHGWVKPISKHNWCGALCIIMNRKAIELVQPSYILLASMAPYYSNALDEDIKGAERPTHLDHSIGETFPNFYTHNPTLIFHTGVISSDGRKQESYIRARMPAC